MNLFLIYSTTRVLATDMPTGPRPYGTSNAASGQTQERETKGKGNGTFRRKQGGFISYRRVHRRQSSRLWRNARDRRRHMGAPARPRRGHANITASARARRE